MVDCIPMDAALESRYQAMRQKVADAGLFKRTYGFYALYAAFVICGLAFSLYVITATTNIYVQLLNALFLAFIAVQSGMLGHDLSHHQVFASDARNRFWGMMAWGIFGGLSESLWFEQHNAHHREVNRDGHDPDINIPFLFSDVQHSGGYSSSWFVRHQHILFFASLPFWYISKLVTTWMQLPHRFNSRVAFEAFIACIHFGALLFLLLYFLPLTTVIAFLAVHVMAVGVYMSLVFAPNHKGEEIISADKEVTWLNQITSTRNIYPSRSIFFLFGGLNFQIEHHLFTNMSRLNYWKVYPIVKQFCAENDISYHETTWPGSFKEMYRALKRTALST